MTESPDSHFHGGDRMADDGRRYVTAYISTGRFQGFYTLRRQVCGRGFFEDYYVRTLSRDWATAYRLLCEYCERPDGCDPITRGTESGDQFALNAWGEGGSQDDTIQRFQFWRSQLVDFGVMPFGKHKGEALNTLPESYRRWIRKTAREESSHKAPGRAKAWQLFLDALAPWQAQDDAREAEIESERAAREAERIRANEASQHVGKIGERLRGIPVRVEFTREFEGFYGVRTLVKMRSQSGDVLIWWATGGRDFERGVDYALTGTVKAHDSYEGTKQTVLSRCNLS